MTHRPPPELLVVCRGGRARSPVASAVLKSWIASHGIAPDPGIVSSGLSAYAGQPLFPDAAKAMKGLGVDAGQHSSHPFDLAQARVAALVITFERKLMRRIVAQDPGLLSRCYTLRELIRLAGSPLWNESWNGTPDLADRLHRLRPRVEAGDDDSPDPAGLRPRFRRRHLQQLITDATAAAPVILGGGRVGQAR